MNRRLHLAGLAAAVLMGTASSAGGAHAATATSMGALPAATAQGAGRHHHRNPGAEPNPGPGGPNVNCTGGDSSPGGSDAGGTGGSA